MQQRFINLSFVFALAASTGCVTTLPGSGADNKNTPAVQEKSQDLANQAMAALSSAAFFTQAMSGVNMGGDVEASYENALLTSAPMSLGAISGAVSVELLPLGVQINVTDLVIGEESLSASISVDASNILTGNASAEISIDYAGSLGEVVLDGLALLTGTAVEINASGTVNVEGVNASFAAVDVVIDLALGSCLPSGGTLSVSSGADSATLTFSPATATTGVAELELNGVVSQVVLEDPC